MLAQLEVTCVQFVIEKKMPVAHATISPREVYNILNVAYKHRGGMSRIFVQIEKLFRIAKNGAFET